MKLSEYKSYDDLPLFLSSPQAPYRSPRRKQRASLTPLRLLSPQSQRAALRGAPFDFLAALCSRWISTTQAWITGEVFDAVFSLPEEVFQLGLKAGGLLVYLYLHYQKGVRSGQC